MISAVAREQDVVRCWIPLQKLKSGSGEEALGTLEFQVNGQRLRFDDVEEGDVVTCLASCGNKRSCSNFHGQGARTKSVAQVS